MLKQESHKQQDQLGRIPSFFLLTTEHLIFALSYLNVAEHNVSCLDDTVFTQGMVVSGRTHSDFWTKKEN